MHGIAPYQQRLVDLMLQLTRARVDNWLARDLFTWQWWFLVILFVVPWVIFYFAANRKMLPKLMLYATFISITISTLDLLGSENGMWTHPHKIIPFASFVCYTNASSVPVIYMLAYQYFPRWKNFIAAIVLTSASFSFIFEPALQAMNIYNPIKWKFIYSFPLYIIIPLILRLAVDKIFAVSQGETGK